MIKFHFAITANQRKGYINLKMSNLLNLNINLSKKTPNKQIKMLKYKS